MTACQKYVQDMKTNMEISQISIGLGSMNSDSGGVKCEWEYYWTNDTLKTFVSYLEQQGVEQIDIWPCSIDKGPPNHTE